MFFSNAHQLRELTSSTFLMAAIKIKQYCDRAESCTLNNIGCDPDKGDCGSKLKKNQTKKLSYQRGAK